MARSNPQPRETHEQAPRPFMFTDKTWIARTECGLAIDTEMPLGEGAAVTCGNCLKRRAKQERE